MVGSALVIVVEGDGDFDASTVVAVAVAVAVVVAVAVAVAVIAAVAVAVGGFATDATGAVPVAVVREEQVSGTVLARSSMVCTASSSMASTKYAMFSPRS